MKRTSLAIAIFVTALSGFLSLSTVEAAPRHPQHATEPGTAPSHFDPSRFFNDQLLNGS